MIRQIKKNVCKITLQDIVGAVMLLTGMVLISVGINHIVSGIVIATTTYYFRKRIE